MCGIGLILFPSSCDSDSIGQRIANVIKSRGPDAQGESTFIEAIPEKSVVQWKLRLFASVLHMRGDNVVKQPHNDLSSYSFLWNGECYSHDIEIPEESIMPYDIANSSINVSDTDLVLTLIKHTLQSHASSDLQTNLKGLGELFRRVCGEYAFILYSASTKSVYFGRDSFGRRSLLISKNEDQDSSLSHLILSSVDLLNTGYCMKELPAGRIYGLSLDDAILKWESIPKPVFGCKRIFTMNADVQSSILPFRREIDISEHLIESSEQLYLQLDRAVRRRVIYAPSSNSDPDDARVAVLFSGGVDSVVLAALAHFHVPINESIDLINVAFALSADDRSQDPFTLSPDRQAALSSYGDLKKSWPERKWRFIAVNVEYSEVLRYESHIISLISPLTSTMDFNIATAFFFASRGIGTVIEDCTTGSYDMKFGYHSANKLDKTICSTPKCKRKANHDCCFHSCKVCCSSYQRLINKYLGGRANLCAGHDPNIRIYNPKPNDVKSVDNFEYQVSKDSTPYYQSCAKIILVGIGADEQMAGYGRHRSTYNRGGYKDLSKELEMEKDRLWTRNLGRDDRCISTHGKEARFPFLDEDLVTYLNSLDVTAICDMTKPQGIGDKMILRIAAKQLGLHSCCGLVKRAIQFGSRIAKVSDADRFGSSRKSSGTSKHMNIRRNKYSDDNFINDE